MSAGNPYGQQAVRSSALAFLAGRGFSALLTFAAFALVARLLSLQDYGLYAATLALLELGLALPTLGLDWVALRTLPDYRVHASGRATAKLVIKLVTLQTLLLVLVGTVLGANGTLLASLLQLPPLTGLCTALGLLVVIEGFGRIMRDQILGILMRQRGGQIAQVVRAGVFAGVLAWHQHHGLGLNALGVLHLELLAASAAASVGLVFVASALWQLKTLSQRTPGWKPPEMTQVYRLALHSYASYLLALAYGPQAITILVSRVLGAEAVAVFGFARGFTDQVRRYLPTDLLQSVLRPAAVAYYSSTADFQGLMLRLGLWFKSALVVLLPLLAYFAVFGSLGATALGGQRFADAWPVLVVLLAGTGTMAWRRTTELACNTVHAADICSLAGLLLLGVLPITYMVLLVTHSVFATAVVLVSAEVVFNLRCQHLLRARGFAIAWAAPGYWRLLAVIVVVVLIMFGVAQFALHAAVAAALTVAISLSITFLMHPLSATELALVASWQPGLAKIIGTYERRPS